MATEPGAIWDATIISPDSSRSVAPTVSWAALGGGKTGAGQRAHRGAGGPRMGAPSQTESTSTRTHQSKRKVYIYITAAMDRGVAGHRGQTARIPVMRRVWCEAIVVSCGCGGSEVAGGGQLWTMKCVEEQQFALRSGWRRGSPARNAIWGKGGAGGGSRCWRVLGSPTRCAYPQARPPSVFGVFPHYWSFWGRGSSL